MAEAFKSPLNHEEVAAEDYEEALNPKSLIYQQELSPPQESRVEMVADQVADQPTEFGSDIDPEARRRFEQFVASRRETMNDQPGFVLDAAPKGVRGVVTRLTKWWRARQDRVAVPSYTRVAPWDLGVVGVAGRAIDNNPNNTLY